MHLPTPTRSRTALADTNTGFCHSLECRVILQLAVLLLLSLFLGLSRMLREVTQRCSTEKALRSRLSSFSSSASFSSSFFSSSFSSFFSFSRTTAIAHLRAAPWLATARLLLRGARRGLPRQRRLGHHRLDVRVLGCRGLAVARHAASERTRLDLQAGRADRAMCGPTVLPAARFLLVTKED